jgi:hypothetical protein
MPTNIGPIDGCDSFQCYTDADKATRYTQYSNASSGSISIGAFATRLSTGLRLTSGSASGWSGWLRKVPRRVPTGAVCIFGFRVNFQNGFSGMSNGTNSEALAAGGPSCLLACRKSNTTQWWLRVEQTGHLSIYRGSTNLGTTSVACIANTVHHIQVYVLLHGSAGVVEVCIDGQVVLSVTGANTQNAGVSTWDEFRFGVLTGANATVAVAYIGDLYWGSATGATDTLNGGINSSVTTITLTDASTFPTSGPFYIRIDDEIMRVTAVSGNDLTVQRGKLFSTAASHLTAAAVTMNCRQGDRRVDPVYLSSDGTYTAATPSGAGSHTAQIDEAQGNGASDYLTFAAAGDKDSSVPAAIPVAGADIAGIQVLSQLQKVDAGAGGFTQGVRVSGTDYFGTERGVPSTFAYQSEWFGLNPNTGAPWADVPAEVIGQKST